MSFLQGRQEYHVGGGEEPPLPTVFRTANDFQTEEDFYVALRDPSIRSRDDLLCDNGDLEDREGAVSASDRDGNEDNDQERGGGDESDGTFNDMEQDQKWDWTLPNYQNDDADTFNQDYRPPSIRYEAKRLVCLNSYNILGFHTASNQEALDRITRMAMTIFDVTQSCLEILDLGRVWMINSHGFGGVREVARQDAWCNHTVRIKEDILLIPDATKDWRFRDSEYVTGPGHLRFYAGAPLVSPEGFRLGSLCMMDQKPRVFSQKEQDLLKDFAAVIMQSLVDRRALQEKDRLITNFQSTDVVNSNKKRKLHCEYVAKVSEGSSSTGST